MTPSRVLSAARISVVVHLAATAASLAASDVLVNLGVSVNLLLFFAGMAIFAFAFFIAAGRSRDEDVWFGGAFLLGGQAVDVAPRRVLRGCLAAQVVIGIGGAALAPFSSAAFSVLAPLFGFGLMAFFGSRYGRFPSHHAKR